MAPEIVFSSWLAIITAAYVYGTYRLTKIIGDFSRMLEHSVPVPRAAGNNVQLQQPVVKPFTEKELMELALQDANEKQKRKEEKDQEAPKIVYTNDGRAISVDELEWMS